MRAPDVKALDWLRHSTAAAPAVMLVCAHPDDETASAAAALLRAPALTIVHLTDGAPRDPWFARSAGCADRASYAALRQAELRSALAVAARPRITVENLGAVDQEAAHALPRLARDLVALV